MFDGAEAQLTKVVQPTNDVHPTSQPQDPVPEKQGIHLSLCNRLNQAWLALLAARAALSTVASASNLIQCADFRTTLRVRVAGLEASSTSSGRAAVQLDADDDRLGRAGGAGIADRKA